MESTTKPKAKRASRASEPRKSAAEVKKIASASPAKRPAKAGARAKSGVQAKSGASEAKTIKTRKGKKVAAIAATDKPPVARAHGDVPPPVLADRGSREQATGESASRLIDRRIGDLGGWRGEALARMRALILQADPEMIEEWKWRGTPVWSRHGIICTGETYKKVVKLTFALGAKVPDPSRLFNSSLEGKTRRAIDIHEGEQLDESAFRALVKAAVTLNFSLAKKR